MYSTGMIYIKLKVPLELYKELQLCPDMILTRSHSSGSLKLLPDSPSSETSDISNAASSVTSKESTFVPISKTSVLQLHHSNSIPTSSLSNTVPAEPTSATKPFCIAYSALSTGNTIMPSINNISPSVIYLPPIPNDTESVLSGSGTLHVNQIPTNIGVFKTNSGLDCPSLTTVTILSNPNVKSAVASSVKVSNKPDIDMLPVVESVLSKGKASLVNEIVMTQERNNTCSSPSAEGVSSDHKESLHCQVVSSNEETNKSSMSQIPYDKSDLDDHGSSDINKVSADGHLKIMSPLSLMNSIESNFPKSSSGESFPFGNLVCPSAENLKASSDLECKSSIFSDSAADSMLDKLFVATVQPRKEKIQCSNSTPDSMENKLAVTAMQPRIENIQCSNSAADSIVNKLAVTVVPPQKEKIQYPRECPKCLRSYGSKTSFSQHKKRCNLYGYTHTKISKPLTFEQAMLDHRKKYPLPKPSVLEDKKWINFSSGKDGFYVKSATFKEKQ